MKKLLIIAGVLLVANKVSAIGNPLNKVRGRYTDTKSYDTAETRLLKDKIDAQSKHLSELKEFRKILNREISENDDQLDKLKDKLAITYKEYKEDAQRRQAEELRANASLSRLELDNGIHQTQASFGPNEELRRQSMAAYTGEFDVPSQNKYLLTESEYKAKYTQRRPGIYETPMK